MVSHLEARCTACGETFRPEDEDDLVHLAREDGSECLGRGLLTGRWTTSARSTGVDEFDAWDWS